MTEKKTSPTDREQPIYDNQNPPPEGYDVCGRRILHRQGRPGFSEDVNALEARLFQSAMTAYRKRTKLKLNVGVWSFHTSDTREIEDDLRQLNALQGIVSL